MKNKFDKRGFTLIELLVASTIIVILSAIGLVSFINAGQGARDAKRKSDMETIRQALVLYRADNSGVYPNLGSTPSNARYNTLMNSYLLPDYISSPAPEDPKDTSPYVYEYGSNGSTFTIEVQLEKTGSDYELTNP